MKVGDLVRHLQQDIVCMIIEKKDRHPAWNCDLWRILTGEGMAVGTDNNLEVISESR